MGLPVYPFTSVLALMKPAKINKENKAQVKKLEQCMHSDAYCWEEKLDGINGMAIGGRVFSNVINKETGWPTEKTNAIPHITRFLKQWPKLVLNGEVYEVGKKCNYITSIINSGVEEALRKQKERGWLHYHMYDILRDIDGTWVVNLPYEERRALLVKRYNELLSSNEYLVLNPSHDCVLEDPQEALDRILAAGYEGIVLKRKDGLYSPGKRPMWTQMKLKASMDDDVVIMAFNPATKKYTGKNLESWQYWEGEIPVTENYYKGLIGSIKIGKYDKEGHLVEVGNVTGLTDALRLEMTERPEDFLGRVIIIKAMEKTSDGLYRHANYMGMHPDKNSFECILEE
jgi:ATP-dependent DNA ligase